MERIMKLQQARMRAKEAGFTLVELAIVLVIIGLIIGGVLVGTDLIKAAEVRATVAQIESYNAAVNTFRTKYRGLPGDIRNVEQFFDAADWPNIKNGDGDRKIEVCDTAVIDCVGDASAELVMVDVASPLHSGEALQFWHHLSAAELVPGYYNACPRGVTAASCVAGQDGELDFSFPRSRLDRNGIGVFADGGNNYFQLGVATGTGAAYVVEPSLTPQEAFDIDGKMDDGRPGTGAVIVRAAQAGDFVNRPIGDDDSNNAATACIIQEHTDPSSTWEYALLNTDVTCSLRFRMN